MPYVPITELDDARLVVSQSEPDADYICVWWGGVDYTVYRSTDHDMPHALKEVEAFSASDDKGRAFDRPQAKSQAREQLAALLDGGNEY